MTAHMRFGPALLALLLCGCGPINNTLKQRYFDEGERLFAAGNYREAALAYRKAVRKDSEFGQAYLRWAEAELKQGGVAKAVGPLRRAVVLMPAREEPKTMLAEIYLAAYVAGGGADEYPIDEAEKLAKLLLARNARSYHGLRLSGHVAASRKQNPEAVGFFRKALTVKPNDPESLLSLAQLLAIEKHEDDAEKLLLAALERNPKLTNAYGLLYRIYASTKRLSEAEEVLKRRVAAMPSDSAVTLELAQHYFRVNKTAEMEATLARLVSNRKAFPKAYLAVGDFYRAIGKIPEARQRYQAGLALKDADQLEYRKRLASILALEGKRDEALQAYDGVTKDLPKDKEAREHRAALLLDKDVDASLKEFQSLIKENPNDPLLHYNLGQAYLAKRDTPNARIHFLEASRRHRAFLLPRLALAQIALDTNQFKDLQQSANDILKLAPQSPEGRFYRCAALTGLANYTEARRELAKLIQEYPRYAEPRLQMAYLDTAEKNYAEAESALKKLYEASKDVRALNGLSQVYLAQNQAGKALAVVQDELKKQPNSRRIRLLVAQTALYASQFDVATENLLDLIEAEPNWDFLYLRLGEAFQAKGDLARAVAAFDKARQISPTGLEAALRLAHALESANRTKEAIEAYRTVLKLNPNVPIALNNLAYLLSEQGGDLSEALRFAQAALQRMPQQENISDTIGYINLKQGQADAALQIFTSLARKYPDNPTFRYHLAMALLQKGDRARARSEAQAALNLKPLPKQEQSIRAMLARL